MHRVPRLRPRLSGRGDPDEARRGCLVFMRRLLRRSGLRFYVRAGGSPLPRGGDRHAEAHEILCAFRRTDVPAMKIRLEPDHTDIESGKGMRGRSRRIEGMP